MRVLVATLIGGVVMFAWGAIAHMFTPLGHSGVSTLPNEAALLEVMKAKIPAQGLYKFPDADPAKLTTDEAKSALAEKHRMGPSGLLIYTPEGAEMMSPRQLGLELASNLLAALCMVVVLSACHGLAMRVLVSTLAGVAGWLSVCASYGIWYNFPKDFVLAEGIMQAAGWFASGLGIALVLGKKSHG